MKPINMYGRDELVQKRIKHLSPAAMLVLCDVILWANNKELEIEVTEAVTDIHEDMALNRISSSHREGRAFDISTKGWSREDIDECKSIFYMKYKNIGALNDQGEVRPVVYHDSGRGFHLHFQVHKRFAVPIKTFNKFDDINKMV